METIVHEKQEGSLCAQHCLNALLQGSYFSPVDLATLAQKLDDEERFRMAECGVESEDYKRFLEQPSGNYDDSGYFSVQVISSALEVWGLELVPYNSTESRALAAQMCPGNMKAFICNYRDHWFTIRRLGHQWFNLNSLLTQPELISDTYLGMFLAQLQKEGYSIFIVFGQFPECEADTLLRVAPAVPRERPRPVEPVGRRLGSDSESDQELQRALRLSLGQEAEDQQRDSSGGRERGSDQHTELQHALARLDRGPSTDSDDEELQRALRLSLQTDEPQEENHVDLDLERALSMSLECCDTSPRLDPEDLRQRRLNYLDGRNRRPNELPSTSNENTGKVIT